MKKNCLAAKRVNKLIEEKKYKTIEVNPTLKPRNISSEITGKTHPMRAMHEIGATFPKVRN